MLSQLLVIKSRSLSAPTICLFSYSSYLTGGCASPLLQSVLLPFSFFKVTDDMMPHSQQLFPPFYPFCSTVPDFLWEVKIKLGESSKVQRKKRKKQCGELLEGSDLGGHWLYRISLYLNPLWAFKQKDHYHILLMQPVHVQNQLSC